MGEFEMVLAGIGVPAVFLDTYGGRVHVEWGPDSAATPLCPLPFFIEVLRRRSFSIRGWMRVRLHTRAIMRR